ncbi:UGT80B1 [Symbiodinium natans]|uniref:UGT80B1 protein n=1 Tax=Symbiodinium natans TaxID=878477 RepID=A0A812LJ51_9DINO|nr:UGT80B1 [Symbiodinium natans]
MGRKGLGSWWHLEPFRLALRCSNRRAAGEVMSAAGTLFRKPELRPLHGSWRLDLRGTERMSFPMQLPDGYEPYAGSEDWVHELVNHDLQRSRRKSEQFARALRG